MFILDKRGRVIIINPYGEHLLNINRNDIALKQIGKYLTFNDTKQIAVFTDTFQDVIREACCLEQGSILRSK